ncbi:hypothetical protein SAMN05216466_102562 [Paraburkholderia phenazinium]|jgi:hypothetical protein|uniref:Uncharacterized protein n=1 Tax=Paraburkholderia phenazinium TaxID=60549 RepID=A0A1G7SKY7_9BURK|nr:hypothetical protein SAMN05216466_102562 [Paraburkholderia phenazinium]
MGCGYACAHRLALQTDTPMYLQVLLCNHVACKWHRNEGFTEQSRDSATVTLMLADKYALWLGDRQRHTRQKAADREAGGICGANAAMQPLLLLNRRETRRPDARRPESRSTPSPGHCE